jgi:hypothetical protein
MAKSPTEAEMPEPAMGMDLPEDMSGVPSPMTEEGSVNISVSKSKFDELHSIAMQLAGAIDALAAEVEGQKAATESLEGKTPAAEGSAMASEEDFLNSIASEGSMR